MCCTPTALPLNAVAACVVPDIAMAADASAGLVLVAVLLLPAAITLTTLLADASTRALVVRTEVLDETAAFSVDTATISSAVGDVAIVEGTTWSPEYGFNARVGLTCGTNRTSCCSCC